MMQLQAGRLPAAADLYNDIEPTPNYRWRHNFPGVTVAALATMAAAFLSDRYGAPLTLMALLIGLALNFLKEDERIAHGLGFASHTLLRWGIVLIGARITISQIASLGPEALLAIIVILFVTIVAGIIVSRIAGCEPGFGILAGGAVAICGASAAMAFATMLGPRRVSQTQLALVLIGISAASASAMFFYPLIAHELGFSDRQAGFMLGAAIHDVAQALGAGYAYSEVAGQVATIVKLTRVALLAPALAVIAFWLSDGGAGRQKWPLPWFVIGFFLLATLNSVIHVPKFLIDGTQATASGLLACAVAATGIRAPMSSLLKTGPRPLLVILIVSLFSVLLACGAGEFLIDP